jgi:DNA modification methylase
MDDFDHLMIKIGDIIELNHHRLICGDATDPMIVERLLNNAQPNLMITEPPYERNYDPSWKQKIEKLNNNQLLKDSWSLFPGTICYIWHSSLEASKIEHSLNAVGFECRSQIIWAKKIADHSGCNYHWQHEPCWYAVKQGASVHWRGSERESTLWMIPTLSHHESEHQEDTITTHSAQKPLECMARPIRNHTPPGASVYDPFCGSGSTLIACEKLHRICYAIELQPAFCNLIIARWINYKKSRNQSYTIKKK